MIRRQVLRVRRTRVLRQGNHLQPDSVAPLTGSDLLIRVGQIVVIVGISRPVRSSLLSCLLLLFLDLLLGQLPYAREGRFLVAEHVEFQLVSYQLVVRVRVCSWVV